MAGAEWAWTDQVSKAIAAKLAAELPAKIDAINADRADDLIVPPPLDYIAADLYQPPTLPAVEIVCNDSIRVEQNESEKRYQHRYTIVFTIAGSDAVELDQQMKRTLLAALLLLDDAYLNEYGAVCATGIRCGNITYDLVAMTEERAPYPWARSGLLDLQIETIT